MITKGDSYAMRCKEDAQDYRYFPDPDLTPIVVFGMNGSHRSKQTEPELQTGEAAALQRRI